MLIEEKTAHIDTNVVLFFAGVTVLELICVCLCVCLCVCVCIVSLTETIYSHLTFLTMSYVVMSLCESLFHRHIMHNRDLSSCHWVISVLFAPVFHTSAVTHCYHHSLTNDDMTLKNGMSQKASGDNEDCQYQGVFFLWNETRAIFLACLVFGTVISYVLSFIVPWGNHTYVFCHLKNR